MANPDAKTKPAEPTTTMETRTCPPQSFGLGEMLEARYIATIPANHTLDDCLEPEYWANHCDGNKMKPMGRITVLDANRRWEADLRIMSRGKGWAKVVLISHTEYDQVIRDDTATKSLRTKYKVEKAGNSGWRVLTPNNDELVAGLATEKDANDFLDLHLQDMSGKAA